MSYITDITEKAKRKQKIKESILQSNVYLDWLENYMERSKVMSTSPDQYEELSEKDKDNIGKLEELFEIIHEYASGNYIYPKTGLYSEYYTISYNNKGYDIEVDYGQGVTFYCFRNDNLDDAIKFDDIRKGKKPEKAKQTEEKFETLETAMEQLINEVPLDAILGFAQKVYTKKNK